MAITSDRMFSHVDDLDIDRRPGSSDIEWAERAYRHQESATARPAKLAWLAKLARLTRPARPTRSAKRPLTVRVPRPQSRTRLLVVALVVVLAVFGLVLGMTFLGSSPAATVHGSNPPFTAITSKSPGGSQSVTLRAPLVRPFGSLFPNLGGLDQR